MAVDSVLAFEKRRNVPVKYNRDLYIKTIRAIDLIERIKQKRMRRFYLARMKQAQLRHMPQMQKQLQKNAHLLEAAKKHSKYLMARQEARTVRDGVKKKAKVAQEIVL